MKYKESEFDLKPSDTLYVYTYGIPEANNIKGELFTIKRTLDTLNKHKGESLDDLLVSVKKEIDEYSEGTERFDDITMVALRMNSYMQKNDSLIKKIKMRTAMCSPHFRLFRLIK